MTGYNVSTVRVFVTMYWWHDQHYFCYSHPQVLGCAGVMHQKAGMKLPTAVKPWTFEAEMKQLVVILNCRNTTVHIPNKVGTWPDALEEEFPWISYHFYSFFPFESVIRLGFIEQLWIWWCNDRIVMWPDVFAWRAIEQEKYFSRIFQQRNQHQHLVLCELPIFIIFIYSTIVIIVFFSLSWFITIMVHNYRYFK